MESGFYIMMLDMPQCESVGCQLWRIWEGDVKVILKSRSNIGRGLRCKESCQRKLHRYKRQLLLQWKRRSKCWWAAPTSNYRGYLEYQLRMVFYEQLRHTTCLQMCITFCEGTINAKADATVRKWSELVVAGNKIFSRWIFHYCSQEKVENKREVNRVWIILDSTWDGIILLFGQCHNCYCVAVWLSGVGKWYLKDFLMTMDRHL